MIQIVVIQILADGFFCFRRDVVIVHATVPQHDLGRDAYDPAQPVDHSAPFAALDLRIPCGLDKLRRHIHAADFDFPGLQPVKVPGVSSSRQDERADSDHAPRQTRRRSRTHARPSKRASAAVFEERNYARTATAARQEAGTQTHASRDINQRGKLRRLGWGRWEKADCRQPHEKCI